jgi:hypothetical protein
MENNRFVFFGLVSLQLIPIFTFVYVQHELTKLSFNRLSDQSTLFNLIGMFVSYCLLYIQILSSNPMLSNLISIVLIIALSVSINYTYTEYTIDEGRHENKLDIDRRRLTNDIDNFDLGYYIAIPYFIVYACCIFLVSTNLNPLNMIQSYRLSSVLICSFIFYTIFSMCIYLGLALQTSLLNYIAYLGLAIGTWHMMFIFDDVNYRNQTKLSSIITMNILLVQLIHIYLYLTHLLSVKFEMKLDHSERILPNRFGWLYKIS